MTCRYWKSNTRTLKNNNNNNNSLQKFSQQESTPEIISAQAMQFQWDRSVELYTEENIVPKPWLTKCLREQALWQKSNKQKHLEKAATMCKNLTSAIVQDATQHNRQCNYPKVNFNTEPGKSAGHRPSSGSVYLMTAYFHFETEMGKK